LENGINKNKWFFELEGTNYIDILNEILETNQAPNGNKLASFLYVAIRRSRISKWTSIENGPY
jgi:hypothetical protein